MSMSEHKTVADIIAEKRARAYELEASSYKPHQFLRERIAELRREADRLEAARKREIDEIKKQPPNPDPDWEEICAKCSDGEVEPDCEYYGEPCGCNSPIYQHYPKKPVGDAAKLREAVERSIDEMQNAIGDADFGDDVLYIVGCIKHTIERLKAALSTPPRNCDVGTAEEQKKRLNEFCCSHGTDIQGAPRCENCALLYADRCELTWAQKLYESEVKP